MTHVKANVVLNILLALCLSDAERVRFGGKWYEEEYRGAAESQP